MAHNGSKRNKHGGGMPDNRPARSAYWANQRLRHNKIRRLMKHNGMTKDQAERHWFKHKTPDRTSGTMRSAIEHYSRSRPA